MNLFTKFIQPPAKSYPCPTCYAVGGGHKLDCFKFWQGIAGDKYRIEQQEFMKAARDIDAIGNMTGLDLTNLKNYLVRLAHHSLERKKMP